LVLLICLVVLGFALACLAVCWEESRNLPKAKLRVCKTMSGSKPPRRESSLV